MNCDEIRPLLEAYLDGELDLVHSLAIEQHVEACPVCQRARKQQDALRAVIRAGLPRGAALPGLTARVRGALRREAGQAGERKHLIMPDWRWLAAAAAVILAFTVAVPAFRPLRSNPLVAEAVANHVRSLLPGHLTDVASTDRHTVKPWVAQRVDYSPTVQDFSAAGFPLMGARLDYLGHRNVAALVYACREHRINVFVAPSPSEEAERWSDLDGFHVATWSQGGMKYVVVSDLSMPELRGFTRQLRGATD